MSNGAHDLLHLLWCLGRAFDTGHMLGTAMVWTLLQGVKVRQHHLALLVFRTRAAQDVLTAAGLVDQHVARCRTKFNYYVALAS